MQRFTMLMEIMKFGVVVLFLCSIANQSFAVENRCKPVIKHQSYRAQYEKLKKEQIKNQRRLDALFIKLTHK
jgi:hypothetical protein